MSDVLITANRLRDGVVVWLGANLLWSEDSKNAACFAPHLLPVALQAAEHDSNRNDVTAVYEIPVNGMADKSTREHIRALGGPTIQPPSDDRRPAPVKRGQHV